MKVARPYDIVRDLLGLDQRLRGSEILTGGRRWGPQDPWNYFNTTGQPALLSPWSAPSLVSGVHQPRWYRDQRNVVHFSGRVRKDQASGGLDLPVFFMPSGLGPPRIHRWWAAVALNAFTGASSPDAYVYMVPGGALTIAAPWSGNADIEHWLSLDGLSYSLT